MYDLNIDLQLLKKTLSRMYDLNIDRQFNFPLTILTIRIN